MLGREELSVYTSGDIRHSDMLLGLRFHEAKAAGKVMDAMEARIKELEVVISKMETTTPKWISVKDRLPEEDGEYQVVYQHKNGAMVSSFDEWDNDCQDWMNATDRAVVVFWAELLPPPTTEEK